MWTTGVRTASRCVAALSLCTATAACSFDSAPIADARVSLPSAGDGDRRPPTIGAAGSGSGSGTVVLPPPSPGTVEPDAGRDAAPSEPDAAAGRDAAAPDAGDGGAIDPPDGGVRPFGLFERCVTDYGCARGLVCYGDGPGHCADACQLDSDCIDRDGIDFTCSEDDDACRVDCGESGTDGACPTGLTCVERGGGAYRCMLPREQGTGDRERFQPCDRAHGDDDCVDDLVCYRSADSQIDGPGYCTDTCTADDPCSDAPDPALALQCAQNVCRFDCSNSACPDGMECEAAGVRNLCHYPR